MIMKKKGGLRMKSERPFFEKLGLHIRKKTSEAF